MAALLRGYLMGLCHCQVSSGPETNVVRKGLSCTGHKIRNALETGKLHIVSFFGFLFLLCLRRRTAGKETLNHKLQKAVLC